MTVAVGRLHLSVTVDKAATRRPSASPARVAPSNPVAPSTVDVERAYNREQARQAMEADRWHWNTVLYHNHGHMLWS